MSKKFKNHRLSGPLCARRDSVYKTPRRKLFHHFAHFHTKWKLWTSSAFEWPKFVFTIWIWARAKGVGGRNFLMENYTIHYHAKRPTLSLSIHTIVFIIVASIFPVGFFLSRPEWGFTRPQGCKKILRQLFLCGDFVPFSSLSRLFTARMRTRCRAFNTAVVLFVNNANFFVSIWIISFVIPFT